MASYSISAYGVERCSGWCSYCSCASTINYTMGAKKDINHLIGIDDYVFEHQYKADWNKVKETLLNDPQIKGKTKEQLAKDHVHFDLWGGDPVTNFRMIKDMVANLSRIAEEIGFGSYNFADSTNGIALLRDEVCEWHEKNGVHIQLSHDGLGQFVRTKEIEPLEYENTKQLIKRGVLNAINTTLNFYNPNMVDNYNFWTNYLKTIFPDIYSKDKMATPEESRIFESMYIKLNHIYNGTDPKKQLNTMGIFNNKFYPQLVNTEFGDFNFINDHERAEKYGIPEMAHVLDDYLNSYKMLIPMMNKFEFIPFYSYIREQLTRSQNLGSTERKCGACRAFQRYKHNIGEECSRCSTTFVIDTMGNYCECNLLYSKYSVKNPGGVQPDYCKNCKYRTYSECMVCGSENFPKRCNYLYAWQQFLEEVKAGIYRIPNRFNPNKIEIGTIPMPNALQTWTPEMKEAMKTMRK